MNKVYGNYNPLIFILQVLYCIFSWQCFHGTFLAFLGILAVDSCLAALRGILACDLPTTRFARWARSSLHGTLLYSTSQLFFTNRLGSRFLPLWLRHASPIAGKLCIRRTSAHSALRLSSRCYVFILIDKLLSGLYNLTSC